MMQKTFIFLSAVLFMIQLTACTGNGTDQKSRQKQEAPELSKDQKGTYLDYTLSPEERARDLLSEMTTKEKISQLSYTSKAIPRLDIPKYNWWNEALHGVARSGEATVFPQAIALGATFDSTLVNKVATAISDEARAMYHAAEKKGEIDQYQGLTFWSPNVNIFRDPRWGRGQETYGEDPYLSGVLGSAFVRGIQGDHPKYLKAAACAKHFAVHSGPEALRHEFNAKASPKAMWETYLPAFKKLIDANVQGVMCAYNRTNDKPCCGSKPLLIDILREQWNFDGYIVSDCWALRDIHTHHNYTETPEESAALALKSTVNLNCGNTYPHLEKALDKGLIKEAHIDSALKTLLKIRIKLGQFDPPEINPYTDISKDVVHSEENRQLARKAAQRSMVLLKNDDVLPLSKDLEQIYVTGPNADDLKVLLGNYHGVSSNLVSILEGITAKSKVGNMVRYNQGVLLDRKNVNPLDWASGTAHQSDATIAVLGINPLLEGEEGASPASPHRGDRKKIGLPQQQVEYLKKLKKDNPNPVIAVVTGGSPIALPEVHKIADAVIFAWYSGEQGGNAVADLIFGDAVPSGRLPMTFPKSVEQIPPYDDYTLKGRTYKYMEKEPLYPFGFGLSYTNFSYSDITLSSEEIPKGQEVNASVKIKNTGDMEGEEVVQLYLTDNKASFRLPNYSLKAFRRIKLAPGESKRISFNITPQMMKFINTNGEGVIEPGKFTVYLSGSLPGERSRELGATKPVKAEFTVNQ